MLESQQHTLSAAREIYRAAAAEARNARSGAVAAAIRQLGGEVVTGSRGPATRSRTAHIALKAAGLLQLGYRLPMSAKKGCGGASISELQEGNTRGPEVSNTVVDADVKDVVPATLASGSSPSCSARFVLVLGVIGQPHCSPSRRWDTSPIALAVSIARCSARPARSVTSPAATSTPR